MGPRPFHSPIRLNLWLLLLRVGSYWMKYQCMTKISDNSDRRRYYKRKHKKLKKQQKKEEAKLQKKQDKREAAMVEAEEIYDAGNVELQNDPYPYAKPEEKEDQVVSK